MSLVCGPVETDRDVRHPPIWETPIEHGAELLRKLLDVGWPEGVVMNVNYPNCEPGAVKGDCRRRCRASGTRTYCASRTAPTRAAAPITGSASSAARAEPPKGTDLWAVRSNFISVTPLCLDYTDQTARREACDRARSTAHFSLIRASGVRPSSGTSTPQAILLQLNLDRGSRLRAEDKPGRRPGRGRAPISVRTFRPWRTLTGGGAVLRIIRATPTSAALSFSERKTTSRSRSPGAASNDIGRAGPVRLRLRYLDQQEVTGIDLAVDVRSRNVQAPLLRNIACRCSRPLSMRSGFGGLGPLCEIALAIAPNPTASRKQRLPQGPCARDRYLNVAIAQSPSRGMIASASPSSPTARAILFAVPTGKIATGTLRLRSARTARATVAGPAGDGDEVPFSYVSAQSLCAASFADCSTGASPAAFSNLIESFLLGWEAPAVGL